MNDRVIGILWLAMGLVMLVFAVLTGDSTTAAIGSLDMAIGALWLRDDK